MFSDCFISTTLKTNHPVLLSCQPFSTHPSAFCRLQLQSSCWQRRVLFVIPPLTAVHLHFPLIVSALQTSFALAKHCLKPLEQITICCLHDSLSQGHPFLPVRLLVNLSHRTQYSLQEASVNKRFWVTVTLFRPSITV